MKNLKQLKQFKQLFQFMLICIFLVMGAALSQADAPKIATLKWDIVPDTENCIIQGYNVYWGTVENEYPNHMDVGNVDTVEDIKTTLGLIGGTTYHFVVTAYTLDEESLHSNVATHLAKGSYIPPPNTVIIPPPTPEQPGQVILKIILEAATGEVLNGG